MAWYAASGARRVRQVSADLGMLVWTFACGVAAWTTKAVVDAVAVPVEQTAVTSHSMSEHLQHLQQGMARVPIAGDELAAGVGSMVGGLDSMTSQSMSTAHTIHVVAWWVAVVVVAIPVLAALWAWLPRRLAFHRESSAAQRFIDSTADLDLFALRAMSNLPMSRLAAVSDDPVGAWRTGDRATITGLAKLELDRLGMVLPPRLGGQTGVGA